jgi:hypothetical protein
MIWRFEEPETGLTLRKNTHSSLVAFHHGREVVENVANSDLTPTTVNSPVRTREYLTEAEIE